MCIRDRLYPALPLPPPILKAVLRRQTALSCSSASSSPHRGASTSNSSILFLLLLLLSSRRCFDVKQLYPALPPPVLIAVLRRQTALSCSSSSCPQVGASTSNSSILLLPPVLKTVLRHQTALSCSSSSPQGGASTSDSSLLLFLFLLLSSRRCFDVKQLYPALPLPLLILIAVLRHQTALSCSSCLLYTSPSPRDLSTSRMPSSA